MDGPNGPPQKSLSTVAAAAAASHSSGSGSTPETPRGSVSDVDGSHAPHQLDIHDDGSGGSRRPSVVSSRGLPAAYTATMLALSSGDEHGDNDVQDHRSNGGGGDAKRKKVRSTLHRYHGR